MIDVARLKDLLSYDPKTGELRWLERPGSGSFNTRWAGGPALYCIDTTTGYRVGNIEGRRYPAHRVAFALMVGRWPRVIDHINGDPADNRWSNLRECTQRENLRNTRARTSHGFKGVYSFNNGRTWYSKIRRGSRFQYLGTFESIEDAARAYDAAARIHYREFARLNFPGPSERAA